MYYIYSNSTKPTTKELFMPIYEYECDRCGRITEVLQGLNDPPIKKCSYCRGKLSRIISLSSFHLKGTGWYATDYAKNAGIPPEIAKENPALSGSENKNGDKTEKISEPKKPRKSGMRNMEKSDVKVE
jgi:putative FmdB family regulatory protein